LKSKLIETNDRNPFDNGLSLSQALNDALTKYIEMSFSRIVRLYNADSLNDKGYENIWPSSKDIGNFLVSIACFIAARHATVSRAMLTHIMEYFGSQSIPCNRRWFRWMRQRNRQKKRKINVFTLGSSPRVRVGLCLCFGTCSAGSILSGML
jgi:hypothetical protein